MLENLLQELIEALNNNTAATLAAMGQESEDQQVEEQEPVAEAPKASKGKAKKAPEPEPEPEPEVEDEPEPEPEAKSKASKTKKAAITLEMVKTKVGELSDEGLMDAKRARAQINELGFNALKDMDDESLADMMNWLLSVEAEADNADEDDEL